MSEVSAKKHIVLFGKGIGILQGVKDLLEQRGNEVSFYQVTEASDIASVGEQFKGQTVDLAVLGAALSDEQREGIRESFSHTHPAVVFFKASAPIPPMIAAQVEAALAGKQTLPSAPVYDPNAKAFTLTMPEAAEAKVTCYWIVSQETVTSTQQELFSGRLEAGERSFAVPEDAAAHWSFATVDAGQYFVLVPLTAR